MEDRICVKCGEVSENGLPLCSECRISLKEFVDLAKYLNGFEGDKDDLLWIISSEISDRESRIINNVRVKNDYANGVIDLIPIEPSGSTLAKKPRLWNKYVSIKLAVEEIGKLRKALRVAKEYYGVT
jgi:hypothetical protein